MFDNLFIGVMHSGKSEQLVSLYNSSLKNNKKAYLLLPSLVFSKTPFIEIFNQERYTNIINLTNVYSVINTKKDEEDIYLYIDEIQFISDKEYDLISNINNLSNVHISCAGLKENYLSDDFAQTKKIISLSNITPISLEYMCEECNNNIAHHNILLKKNKIVLKSLNKNNIVLETDDVPLYKSVCSECRDKFINLFS